MKSKRFLIGIDPGTNTGVAIWDRDKKAFSFLDTCTILEAVQVIRTYPEATTENTILFVENPNLRQYFGNTGREKLQGAGSVKRDYAIWEEFAESHSYTLIQVHPKDVKDMSGKQGERFFSALTGVTKRTSVHAREAAYMVFNR